MNLISLSVGITPTRTIGLVQCISCCEYWLPGRLRDSKCILCLNFPDTPLNLRPTRWCCSWCLRFRNIWEFSDSALRYIKQKESTRCRHCDGKNLMICVQCGDEVHVELIQESSAKCRQCVIWETVHPGLDVKTACDLCGKAKACTPFPGEHRKIIWKCKECSDELVTLNQAKKRNKCGVEEESLRALLLKSLKTKRIRWSTLRIIPNTILTPTPVPTAGMFYMCRLCE